MAGFMPAGATACVDDSRKGLSRPRATVAKTPIVQWQDRLRPGCGFESRLASCVVRDDRGHWFGVLEGILTMRLVSLAIAMAALVCMGASAPGAMTRTKPPATAFATVGKWRLVTRMSWFGGEEVRGYIEWTGLADSVDWSSARYFDINGRYLSPTEMIGATVVYLGAPFPGL